MNNSGLVAVMLFGFVSKAQLDVEKCSCSKEYAAGYECSRVIDGDNSSGWNSGDFAPQWVKLTLSIPHSITNNSSSYFIVIG